MFATSLIYYEPAKDESGVTQSRMDTILIKDQLLNHFTRAGDNLDDVFTTHGLVASGEKLIADDGSTDRARITKGVTDKTLGVEMEAAGVGRAVNRLCPSAEFVVIKGISDLADKKKGSISQKEQTRNRKTAASNAARCLAHLMREAPLRRISRSDPRPSEATWRKTARDEAIEISATLKPYGITTDPNQLYACLYGRRGRPIPAYYHWRQKSEALHWIDFKILTALKALPREIVTPIPLVTTGVKGVHENQSWHRSVKQLLEEPPRTNAQIKEQLEELSFYLIRIGFPEQAIRSELETLLQEQDESPEIVLNMMRYMLGQFCHRRMFVFAWKSSQKKWGLLSRAYGVLFSLFEWDTMRLGGEGGKQKAPGKDLLIEPDKYESLNRWALTSPAGLVEEFVNHFECHLEEHYVLTSSGPQPDARDHLRALMQHWNRLFGGQA